jgi:hypothetical protein
MLVSLASCAKGNHRYVVGYNHAVLVDSFVVVVAVVVVVVVVLLLRTNVWGRKLSK